MGPPCRIAPAFVGRTRECGFVPFAQAGVVGVGQVAGRVLGVEVGDGTL
jgi:hypothetical protein